MFDNEELKKMIENADEDKVIIFSIKKEVMKERIKVKDLRNKDCIPVPPVTLDSGFYEAEFYIEEDE